MFRLQLRDISARFGTEIRMGNTACWVLGHVKVVGLRSWGFLM